ncbi:hypothetical protein HAX54_032909, partial [Datura stramonium]|nr:hypothetical protein [Datura stramonium]
ALHLERFSSDIGRTLFTDPDFHRILFETLFQVLIAPDDRRFPIRVRRGQSDFTEVKIREMQSCPRRLADFLIPLFILLAGASFPEGCERPLTWASLRTLKEFWG